jgi:hypothetical protein
MEVCILPDPQATWCNDPTYQTTRYHNTRGAQISQKSRSHLKILDAGRVTWKFSTKDRQILGATVQSTVSTATWHPEVVHPCIMQFITWHSVITLIWKFLRVGSGIIKGTEVSTSYYLRGLTIRAVHKLNCSIISPSSRRLCAYTADWEMLLMSAVL